MQTLIILHGWGSAGQNWQGVGQALESDELKVLTPDMPGFGQSPLLSSAWSVKDYVEWLYDYCEKRNISQFFLFGHSFGGRIAIKFAAKYPKKLKGIILCSSAGIKPKKNKILHCTNIAVARFVQWLRIEKIPVVKDVWQFLRKFFYRFILRKTDYLKAQGIMEQVFKNVIEEDLTPYLSQIKAPTLILWGKKDKMTPVKDAYLMHQKISNSRLQILENIGHSPHLESPRLLAEKIREFIKITATRPS